MCQALLQVVVSRYAMLFYQLPGLAESALVSGNYDTMHKLMISPYL